ncbi:MAG: CoA transferase [Candidatus Eremiobacteraeota bacterium]|nr:CoA transferase [Candidatus Eremiobacteraeota bacterium]
MQEAIGDALDGIAVVALATNIPGPLAAASLRSMGARVTKVEPQHGDPLQAAAARWYAAIVAGMEVERLDLRSGAGKERMTELLSDADLLVTSTRAGALARAQLDWPVLHERYPRLSHVAIVGEGFPNDDRAGHDLTYQARAGLLSPPAMPRTVVADLAAAQRSVTAALAALRKRDREGRGVRVDVAIVDAAADFAAPLRYGLTGPRDVLGGGFAAYSLYRASDGWVAVAALEEHFASRLRSVLGIDRLSAPELERAIAARSMTEWERLAEEHDLPLAAVSEEKG